MRAAIQWSSTLIRFRSVVTILAFVALVSPLRAQVPGDTPAPISLFPTNAALSRYMHEYRRRASPAEAFALLSRVDVLALQAAGQATPARDDHYLVMLVAFYVHVARANPAAFDAHVGRVIATRNRSQILVAHLVAFGSALPQSAGWMRRLRAADPEAASFMEESVRAVTPWPRYAIYQVVDGKSLDVLWAAYFGSGDARYIDRIASVLVEWKPFPQAKAEVQRLRPACERGDAAARLKVHRILASFAAYMFLRNNARVHPQIATVLRRIAQDGSRAEAATVRRILGEI